MRYTTVYDCENGMLYLKRQNVKKINLQFAWKRRTSVSHFFYSYLNYHSLTTMATEKMCKVQ